MLHRGAERALGRIVFAVIAIAMASVYAATLVPGADWPHSFGLGGLFGDTVLGALIGMVPGSPGVGLKLVSLLVGAGVLGMMLFVTGFDLRELRSIGRFLMMGSILVYSQAMVLAGRSAQGTARAAQALNERRRTAAMTAGHRRQAAVRHADLAPELTALPRGGMVRRPMTEPAMSPAQGSTDWGRPAQLRAEPRYAEPLAEAPHYAPPREKVGLLARMPSLMRRLSDPEPELIEPVQPQYDGLVQPDEDRIKARISDVIKARIRNPGGPTSVVSAAVQRREPALVRPRGPVPLVADLTPQRGMVLPPEPPVFAGATVAAPMMVPPLGAALRGVDAPMQPGRQMPPMPQADDDAEDWQDDDNMFHPRSGRRLAGRGRGRS